jgi:spore coat-associated protein N
MTTRMDELLREMITPPPPRRDPARRKRLIATVGILGLAGLGMTSLVTSAIFTDNDETGRSGIITGSVDIEAGESAAFELPPGNLAPGEWVYSPVTVTNEGSLALVYTVDYLATSDAKNLASTLSLDVFALPADECDADGVDGVTAIGSAGPGLASAATPIVDTERPLSSSVSETLCVRVAVPLEIGNDFQNATADLALTFLAEQDPTDPHR